MVGSIKDFITFLEESPSRKFYVYRLIDSRTYQTFYVGKGCGDRVFLHVDNVRKLVCNYQVSFDDTISLKEKLILEIIASGNKVIPVIHRYGLTEKEAFEVEAALIDAFSGLTNIQRGHFSERGPITVEDLRNVIAMSEYTEPDDKYIIIKTTPSTIISEGSLYEATRKSWRADLTKAKKYKYVVSVVYGVVREVSEVSKWYAFENGRIAFDGKPATDAIAHLKNKRIPQKYRQKGASNPFMYKKINFDYEKTIL